MKARKRLNKLAQKKIEEGEKKKKEELRMAIKRKKIEEKRKKIAEEEEGEEEGNFFFVKAPWWPKMVLPARRKPTGEETHLAECEWRCEKTLAKYKRRYNRNYLHIA